MSLPGQPDPGQTQYKILQAAPGGYLVDFGDGQPVLVPESSLVDQGEVNPTPGMYEQHAQFAGGRNLASQPKLDEAAAYTQEMHQQYPGTEGDAPARGPTPTVGSALPANWVPQATDRPEDAAAMAGLPPGAVYDADPNGNGGQPAPAPRLFGPPAPPQSQSNSYSTSWSGNTGTTPAPVAPDLSPYEDEITSARAVRDKYYGQSADYADQEADIEAKKQAAIEPLRNQIPADVKREQEVRAALDDEVNQYVQQERDRIMQRVASVPQVDPGKIWSDKPAWQSALGLLSAVTGGMLAVTTGSGKNMGLEAIERAIERDVQAQQANIDNEWKRVANDKDSLSQYQQWKATQRERSIEEGMMRREAMAFALDTEAGKFTSQSLQASKRGAAAAFRAKNAEEDIKLDTERYNRAKAAADTAHAQWATEMGLTHEAIGLGAKQAEAAAKNAPDPSLPIYTYANGDRVYISPEYQASNRPEDLSKLKEAVQKKDMFLSEWDDLMADVQELGRTNLALRGKVFFSDEDKEAIRARYELLSLDYVNEKAATTFTDRLLSMVQKGMGGAQGITDVSKLPTMLAFKKATYKKLEAPLRGQEAFIVGRDGTKRPYDGDTRYGASPLSTEDERPLGQQVREAVTGLTAGDPRETLASLEGLTSYGDADLATTQQSLINNFSQMETVQRGNKTVALFPGDKGYKGTGAPNNAQTATQNMRKFTGYAATRAKASGDDATAEAIHQMAGQLEQLIVTGKRASLKSKNAAPAPTPARMYGGYNIDAYGAE